MRWWWRLWWWHVLVMLRGDGVTTWMASWNIHPSWRSSICVVVWVRMLALRHLLMWHLPRMKVLLLVRWHLGKAEYRVK